MVKRHSSEGASSSHGVTGKAELSSLESYIIGQRDQEAIKLSFDSSDSSEGQNLLASTEGKDVNLDQCPSLPTPTPDRNEDAHFLTSKSDDRINDGVRPNSVVSTNPFVAHVWPKPISTSGQLPRFIATNSTANATSNGSISSLSIESVTSLMNARTIEGMDMRQNNLFTNESCKRIEQAELQVEESFALVASEIKRNQSLWSHLANLKSSGLDFDDDTKLSSAAVAVNAASSVTKAAATIFKVASNATLLAKLMVDEILICSNSKSSTPSHEALCLDIMRNNSKMTSTTLKSNCRSGNLDASFVVEDKAKMDSRKLDAILEAVKWAEKVALEAESVIRIGEFIPSKMTEFVEARIIGDEGLNMPSDCTKLPPSFEEKTSGHDGVKSSEANNINEGSLVEVFSNKDGFRGVWFPAKVLTLNDGVAHVIHNVLFNGEESEYLKEWVPLTGEGGKAPRIRLAPPMTSVNQARPTNRQTDVANKQIWSVGDRVDAFVHDGWCEGIIKEKSEEDEAKYTVHFPAQGDMLVVQARKLRPSLTWKDGHWRKWSSSSETDCYFEEDRNPHGKLAKKTRGAKCIDSIPTKRIGPLTEGSVAVSGVPKTGRNTKSMEVNTLSLDYGKHAENTGRDSNSNGLSDVSKADRKRKVADVNKSIVSRKKAQQLPNTRLSIIQKENMSKNKSPLESCCLPSSPSKSSAELDVVTKGKAAALSETLAKSETTSTCHNNDSEKLVHETSEPRRSNRKIQPTSKLLEGLQISFGSWMPSLSPKKGKKAKCRSKSGSG